MNFIINLSPTKSNDVKNLLIITNLLLKKIKFVLMAKIIIKTIASIIINYIVANYGLLNFMILNTNK